MPKLKHFRFEDVLGDQEENIVETILALDAIFLSYPNVTRKIRFNIPFYDYTTWICYINPKNKSVELVFLQGKILQETFPFLQDKGRKTVAGLEIEDLNDDTMAKIIMVWEEALSLH